MPYGLLGFAATWLMGWPVVAISWLAIAFINRILESWIVGWGVVRDPRARNAPWLYPVRDLLGFAVWCASYLSNKSLWRDGQYQLLPGGVIVRRAIEGQADSQE